MKKLAILSLLLSFLFFTGSVQAQQQTKKETKKETHATVTKKNGEPDMRYKVNKDAKQTTTVQKSSKAEKMETKSVEQAPREERKMTTTTRKTSTATTSSTDKMVGKDDKGRTIYEGPKGGRYYITANGNKEYIKH